MTGIRHFTASAIVFDEHQRVLFVHHNKLGQWLYPGGHIDPNEDPAQAALREVLEETGVSAEVISDPLPGYPSVTVHPPPYAILEMQVSDSKIGTHQHIDHVYVLRATSGRLTAQREEVSAARWVPMADVAALDTPAELPALVADASQWAKDRL
jgi:8-oxo-dGTP pyrophosphatase MutT (NUDIX family)